MIKNNILAFILSLVICPLLVFSQSGGEILVGASPVHSNQVRAKSSVAATPIQLPFFDDFSRGETSPNSSLWQQGEHVYVNRTYPVNSPTIGVATFDALNAHGQIHAGASTFPFSADTLTSRPIDIYYPHDSTIYLSFWVQPQGLGNQPDPRDSLVLEFYDSIDSTWVRAWAASANFAERVLNERYHLRSSSRSRTIDSLSELNTTFFQVLISLYEERFISQDFQFRFRNYASVSENSHFPGLRSNSDHWHLDLVYINRGRAYNDSLLNDIAINAPIGSILNNYESIPWLHFNSQARSAEIEVPLELETNYSNLGDEFTTVTRTFFIDDLSSPSQPTRFSGGSESITPLERVHFIRKIEGYSFTSQWDDSAHFAFTHTISYSDAVDRRFLLNNDTVRYTQSFVNYYAYDDGSAEMGYGLYGEGAHQGMVAVRFNSYESDWLKGVYIYFNQTYNDVNAGKYFRLRVWDDDNGKPGSLVAEQLGTRVTYRNELNRFTLYKFDDPVWMEAGTFYVGWAQVTADMLNVGFDLNRVNNDKLFFSIASEWSTSQFKGSLMIRPVFGYFTETPTSAPVQFDNPDTFSLYPNPTQGWVNVKLQNDPNETIYVRVFNTIGQQLILQPLTDRGLDLGHLPRGTYILRVFSASRSYGAQKLMVQ